MKIRATAGMALAVLWIILNGIPALDAKAEDFTEGLDEMQDCVSSSDSVSSSDPGFSSTVSGEVFLFSAGVEYFPEGYVVRGTLAQVPSDVCLIQPLSSTDGESWQISPREWDLSFKDSQDPEASVKLRTQTCLNDAHEPFRAYLAGELDHFYVKLRLTEESGAVYETEAAVIRRGDPQPLPEDLTLVVMLDQSILIRQWRPSYREYGACQLTIGENASVEDVKALLPETLPVRIDLYRGIDFVGGGIVDYPVVWKSLTLPGLTAGESVVLPDAAEEFVIPAGTLLNTPQGIYRLEEALGMDHSGPFSHSDEIRVILNVTAEEEESEGGQAPPQVNDGAADQPNKGGTGGNEGNAGTDDRGDSTAGGQRPYLPEESVQGIREEAPGQQESGESRDTAEGRVPFRTSGDGESGGASGTAPEESVQGMREEAPGQQESGESRDTPEGRVPFRASGDGESGGASGTAPEESVQGMREEAPGQQESGESRDTPESRVPFRASGDGTRGYTFPLTAAGIIIILAGSWAVAVMDRKKKN